MGVGARITLPGFVCLRDAADVLGILAGAVQERGTLNNTDGAWYVHAADVETKPSGDTLPECARIHLNFTAVDGHDKHFVLYHFEWGHDGTRGLMPRSTPFWLAVGKGLVDFFGGQLDYNDCDDEDVDYEVPAQIQYANLDSDARWQRFQEAKWALKPVSREDMDAMAAHAAYTLSGEWR